MTDNRSLLTLFDLSHQEFLKLLGHASDLKEQNRQRDTLQDLKMTLLFEKPSTRTRVSFEAGLHELQAIPIPLNADEIQLSRGEPVRDTARVLSRYADGIIARVYNHSALVECVKFGSVPIINALSDLTHPCQALSDFLTIQELKSLKDVTIAYIGDGNNVCHSLIHGATLAGARFRVATPPEYTPNSEILSGARKRANDTGAALHYSESPEEAVAGADVLYTDVWTSMGDEDESEKRRQTFRGYQINRELLQQASENAIVMHCLPAHRGEEITDEVLESEQSVVWQQAENRLHTQKALLEFLFTDEF